VVPLDANAPEELGRTPWGAPRLVVLDWSASFELGYGPAGDYATTVREEIEWLSSVAIRPDEVRLPDYLDVEFFKRSFDYPAEDNFLRERSGL
jgi:hypothetical protein